MSGVRACPPGARPAPRPARTQDIRPSARATRHDSSCRWREFLHVADAAGSSVDHGCRRATAATLPAPEPSDRESPRIVTPAGSSTSSRREDRWMLTPDHVLTHHGGVARGTLLHRFGLDRRMLERAVREGSILRVRQGVFAARDAEEDVVTRAQHGGALTCAGAASARCLGGAGRGVAARREGVATAWEWWGTWARDPARPCEGPRACRGGILSRVERMPDSGAGAP